MKFVAERQRMVRREKKLHVQTRVKLKRDCRDRMSSASWLLIGLLETLDVEFFHLQHCPHHSFSLLGIGVAHQLL